MIKVSVVIPAYNCAKFISDTIKSVLEQTFRDFEVIVVDDGSTDHTEEVLKSFARSVRYIKQKNSGVSTARNRAISEAKGEYIAFVDHDDLWLPDKLEKQMKLFESPRYNNIGIVFSDCFLVNKRTGVTDRFFRGSKPSRGKVLKELVLSNFIPCLTAVIPSRVVSDMGFFSKDLCIAEEYELFLKIAEKHTVDYLDEPLAKYMMHKTNFSRNTLLYNEEKKKVVLEAIEKNPHLKEELRLKLNRKFSELNYQIGSHYLVSGRAKESRSLLISSLKNRFSILAVILLMVSCLGKPGRFLIKLIVSVFRTFRKIIYKNSPREI